MHNLRVVGWVLFGAKWGLQPSDSSERLFQSGSRGRSMHKISVKGEFNTIKCLLYKRFSATQEDLMSSGRGLVLFSRYEEIQGLESWNQFLKIPSHLKSSPTRSLEHRVPPSTLSSLRGCWRSAAAAAQGSVSAEADGKCPCSVTGNALQFSSVAQLCPTLCDPMDCSKPGFPVHHQLPELAQTHVHWVSDAIQPSHPLLSPSPTFNLSSIRVFSNESVLHIRWPKYWEFQLQHQSYQWIFRIDFL